MDLLGKILINLYIHVMECLNTWANKDQELIKHYIETEVKSFYKTIGCLLCGINDDCTISPCDPEITIDAFITEQGFTQFHYEIDVDTNIKMRPEEFYHHIEEVISGIFSEELNVELMKYSKFPKGKKFTLEVCYRVYISVVILNEFYKLRNRINDISPIIKDKGEMLASSMFCKTVVYSLLNGSIVPVEECEYGLVDIFGLDKELDVSVFVDKNCNIWLTDMQLDRC